MGCLYNLVAVLATAAVVTCAPTHQLLRRNGTTPITGFQGGGIQPRLEIRTLAQEPYHWNIFLLGLAKFQAMDISDDQSYHQIAGIHGASWGAWDNDSACDGCESSGYCPHHSTLFPTWHRPYLALFEQSLIANAIAVANTFNGTEQTKYTLAATTLRMPYLDWAITPAPGQDAFPSFLTNPKINVTTPSGRKEIDNPLYSYKFPKGAPQLGAPYNVPETTRYPDSNGVSQNDQVVTSMNSIQPGQKSNLWMLFAAQSNYSYMSTEMWMSDGGPSSYNNLESIHDNVHVSIGGDGGFMTEIAVSAFDPSFFASGGLKSMNVEDVSAYLESKFEWRVVKMDGTVVDAVDVPGLVVSVVTSEVTPAKCADGLPTWGEFVVLETITKGKMGGLADGTPV